jgi:death-on-curing protein
MHEPVWIREIEALAFHAQQIALFGGLSGVRDLGVLESALARPRNLFVYTEKTATMAELAAAYAAGISGNHPFVDGNKRTAMQTAFVFLEFNGITVTANQEEAYLAFMKLAAGTMDEAALTEWFHTHSASR